MRAAEGFFVGGYDADSFFEEGGVGGGDGGGGSVVYEDRVAGVRGEDVKQVRRGETGGWGGGELVFPGGEVDGLSGGIGTGAEGTATVCYGDDFNGWVGFLEGEKLV